MKKYLGATLATCCLALVACDVDQTKEAKLPDVDVNASGGQMPEFDVKGPDVDVKMENKTVQVPDVDVQVPSEKE
jgi:hypothetical protein